MAVLGIIYLLALIVIYDIYEIGYIQNDTETIKREGRPTLRLSSNEQAFYRTNNRNIWLSRGLIAMASLVILYTAMGEDKARFLVFLSLMVVMLGAFWIYNESQGKWKILLHFILVSVRFMAFPFLLDAKVYLQPSFWLLIFIFPLPNLIERSSERKFNLPIARKLITERRHIDRFRFYYYMLMGVGAVLLTFSDSQYWIIGFLVVYFLIYRFLIFLKLFSFTRVSKYDDARTIGRKSI